MQRARVLLSSSTGWRRLAVGTYLIGRGNDCDLVVPSHRASRKHARLVVTETGAWLEDLSSLNGTHVNGNQIEGRRVLESGQFIGVGTSGLHVTIEADSGPCRVPVLTPRSVPPLARKAEAHGEETILHNGDHAVDHAFENWAETMLAQAREGRLSDDDTQDSAIRFGVQRAVASPNLRWVDFVVELAALGLPLSPERAHELTPAVERVGVSTNLIEAYLTLLRNLPSNGEREALRVIAERWQSYRH